MFEGNDKFWESDFDIAFVSAFQKEHGLFLKNREMKNSFVLNRENLVLRAEISIVAKQTVINGMIMTIVYIVGQMEEPKKIKRRFLFCTLVQGV